jgi:uncharacterized GH25 family protein
MGNVLDVHVLDDAGEPLKGAEVQVQVEGIFSGGFLTAYTDDQGHAEFETQGDYEGSRHIKIYVRGQSFGPYDISGGAYTVQVD